MTKREALRAISNEPSIVDELFKTLHIYEASEREKLRHPVPEICMPETQQRLQECQQELGDFTNA